MRTTFNRITQSFLLCGAIFLVESASAFYDSGIGRWINRDPIGDVFREPSVQIETMEGPSLYAFVGNDPIRKIDAVGLKKIYGNWCGPDWTGGKKGEYDPNSGPYAPPIDALDSACEIHDKCYFNCRQSSPCDAGARSKCFRNCDKALTKAAYAFGGAWGRIIGAAIDRPGTRDAGPNKPCCNTAGSSPPPRPPIPLGF